MKKHLILAIFFTVGAVLYIIRAYETGDAWRGFLAGWWSLGAVVYWMLLNRFIKKGGATHE